MTKKNLIALILVFSATNAWADDHWRRVEKLHHGSTISVTTNISMSCVFQGADDRALTCDGKLIARESIQRICLLRNHDRAVRWGSRVGAVLGAASGAAIGAEAGWRGSILAGALFLPLGAGAGAIAGHVFGPDSRVVYVHP